MPDPDQYANTASATTQQFTETFLDLKADGVDIHLVATSASAATVAAGSFNGVQIDQPRSCRVTTTAALGNVILTGTLADGTTGQTDTIVTANATVEGVKAFSELTSIQHPDSTSHTIAIELSNKLGLVNSIAATADVYKCVKNGAHSASPTVVTANNTVSAGAISANDDVTVRYKGTHTHGLS